MSILLILKRYSLALDSVEQNHVICVLWHAINSLLNDASL